MKTKRSIIQIDASLCNGCGLCVSACHEGAIQLIDGKAKLVSESYCDGLGACLPECPTGAIELIEREAEAFDEALVQQAQSAKHEAETLPCGCPGTQARALRRPEPAPEAKPAVSAPTESDSALEQWPVQIQLVNPAAPYLQNAHLLVAADCSAYAYGNFHNAFMRGKVTLIGCPKLDDADYSEKLGQILARNEIRSITVIRMEVPCCGGIVTAVKRAMLETGKIVPYSEVILSTDGQIVNR